jgi:hypothetical protein
MAKARFFGGDQKTVMINCPGCGHDHFLNIDPTRVHITYDKETKAEISRVPHPCWDFNGDMERPTFNPSLLVRTGIHIPGTDHQKNVNPEDWSDYVASSIICHSFIRDGQIQLLGDCTHENAGKTMDLLEVREFISSQES